MRKRKEVLLYKETYKKHAAILREDKLPELRHICEGFKVTGAELLAAGCYEIDGRRVEFNDIRVFVEEK